MSRDGFDENLKWGAEAEIWVAAWLMRRGWRILPTYDFSGKDDDKAPRLAAVRPADSLVIPDLLSARGGTSRWVEVKRKTRADLYRKTGVLETGISRRLWTHYHKTQQATGIEVWIAFVHDVEGEVRVRSIDDLNALPPREYLGTKMGRDGMVFFPWEQLLLLTTVEECRAEYIRQQDAA